MSIHEKGKRGGVLRPKHAFCLMQTGGDIEEEGRELHQISLNERKNKSAFPYKRNHAKPKDAAKRKEGWGKLLFHTFCPWWGEGDG